MKLILWICIAIATHFPTILCQIVNETLADQAKSELAALIGQDRRRIGGFARLSFHDCVGEGGCDGCINHLHPSNAGLAVYTEPLNELYDAKFLNTKMSRADLWHLAGVVALEEATNFEREKFDSSRFKFGRKDCKESPNEDELNEELPLATWNFKQVTSYYKRMFQFTEQETIALLGVHTLGKAHQRHSGFEGSWSRTPVESERLNNHYYTSLIGVGWISVSKTRDGRHLKPQWQLPFPGGFHLRNTPNDINSNMFFNSDVCLMVDFKTDPSNHDEATCQMCRDKTPEVEKKIQGTPGISDLPCCAKSPGFDLVNTYHTNNTRWLEDFTNVFYKMTNRIGPGLSLDQKTADSGSRKPGFVNRLMNELDDLQDSLKSMKDRIG